MGEREGGEGKRERERERERERDVEQNSTKEGNIREL